MKKQITISGKRWFEKTNGNTYFSCDIFVNGTPVNRIPFNYGYGSMYEQAAIEWLENNGHLKKDEKGKYTPRWVHEENEDVKIISVVSDVSRRKDL